MAAALLPSTFFSPNGLIFTSSPVLVLPTALSNVFANRMNGPVSLFRQLTIAVGLVTVELF